MTGCVILEISEDQRREKAAEFAARLTRILDPSKVRVATPFRAAEARVIRIGISATKEEIRNTMAKESGCKAEDSQLREIRFARNGLGSVWIRGPAGAVRKLAQADKVVIRCHKVVTRSSKPSSGDLCNATAVCRLGT